MAALASAPSHKETFTVSEPSTRPIDHIKRTYQSFPGANYVLPSDAPERERLALQHKLLRRAFGDRLIHPPITISPNDHILDSGTGSGSWLLDVLDVAPSTTVLHGLDIEPRLFPSKADRVVNRGNVEFHVGTITQLPQEWSDKFVLAHQRLLVAALQTSEWKQALAEILRTLVPGGWLQLGEVGNWSAGDMTKKHIALMQMLFKTKGLLLDCSVHIPEMLQEAGFVNITVDTAMIPLGEWAGVVGSEARDNFMGVFRGMKTPVLDAGGLGFVTTESEWDALLDSVEMEWNHTPGAEIQFNIFSAMKPLPQA